jgi:hypothetical protein
MIEVIFKCNGNELSSMMLPVIPSRDQCVRFCSNFRYKVRDINWILKDPRKPFVVISVEELR